MEERGSTLARSGQVSKAPGWTIGRIDVVLQAADRLRQVAIEAKNWNRDTLAKLPQSMQLERINELVAQAERYVAPGELAAQDIIYAFPRMPTTAQGMQILQRITAELNRLDIRRIAVGVEDFILHPEQMMAS